ncbi:MAG: hypothetical protein WCS94_07980 [Verrucomicrobiota bacterium]
MNTSSNVNEWVWQAFASGAKRFTLWTGIGTVIYSVNGEQTKDETKRATFKEVEDFLRLHLSSREIRQFRASGIVRFKSLVESSVFVVGWAKLAGNNIRVDIRKTAACWMLPSTTNA